MPKRSRSRRSTSSEESTSSSSSPAPSRIRRSASDGSLQARHNSELAHAGETPRPTRRQPVEHLGPPRSERQMRRLDIDREVRHLEILRLLDQHALRRRPTFPAREVLRDPFRPFSDAEPPGRSRTFHHAARLDERRRSMPSRARALREHRARAFAADALRLKNARTMGWHLSEIMYRSLS